MNYSMEEYARDVVYTLQQICTNEEVPEPNIVSESGRALDAHHSCLMMNVFGHIEFGENGAVHEEPSQPGRRLRGDGAGPETQEAPIVREMREIVAGLLPKNSARPTTTRSRRRSRRSPCSSSASSRSRSAPRSKTCSGSCAGAGGDQQEAQARARTDPRPRRSRSPTSTSQLLALPVAPDHWAIDQLFPIVPIHRLTEQPTRDSTLVDITCDSDGKVDKFIDLRDVRRHARRCIALRPGEPYYLGMFLTGAYQDIMGDMHNLFGRVNEVHVFLDDDEPRGLLHRGR